MLSCYLSTVVLWPMAMLLKPPAPEMAMEAAEAVTVTEVAEAATAAGVAAAVATAEAKEVSMAGSHCT